MPSSFSKILGRNKLTLIVILIMGLGTVFVYRFVTREHQMRSFCSTLVQGSSPSQVRVQAEHHGYLVDTYKHGRHEIIADPNTLGRFACVVRFGHHGLVTARYQHH